jgi:hypothetical protein
MAQTNDPNPKPKPIRIIQIAYGYTINIGNYENVRTELTASVDQDDDWREVLASLRRKLDNIKKFEQDRYAYRDGDVEP